MVIADFFFNETSARKSFSLVWNGGRSKLSKRVSISILFLLWNMTLRLLFAFLQTMVKLRFLCKSLFVTNYCTMVIRAIVSNKYTSIYKTTARKMCNIRLPFFLTFSGTATNFKS